MIIEINHREALGFWLNRLNLFGSLEMAEIGCAHGSFAKTVLRQWTGERYWMIDPWKVQDVEVYKENQPTQEQYDQQFAECEELSKRDARVRIIRDTSTEAAKQFKTGQLVCAYIDANHSYRSAMEDMDAWWDKVQPGGIMGGHDFRMKTDEGWFCEVEEAVKRWALEHNVPFTVTPCTSWWIVKP